MRRRRGVRVGRQERVHEGGQMRRAECESDGGSGRQPERLGLHVHEERVRRLLLEAAAAACTRTRAMIGGQVERRVLFAARLRAAADRSTADRRRRLGGLRVVRMRRDVERRRRRSDWLWGERKSRRGVRVTVGGGGRGE